MNDYKTVLDIFRDNYVLVPLEVFHGNAFKTLISTLMSSRTNDDTTLPAAERLFDAADNPNDMAILKAGVIEELIYPIGFYKTKARNIIKLCEILVKDYDSKVPDSREELMTLPGVGRKTANLVLNRAFDRPAIAVDTHVHRISNLLGWVDTKTPQQTEFELMEKVPQKYWSDLNNLLVSVGRQYRSERELKEFLKKNMLV